MPNRTAKMNDVVTYRTAGGETRDVVVTGVQPATPTTSHYTATGAITGGTLAAATYTYKISVVVDGVESAASATKTGVVASGATGSVTIDATALLAAYPRATSWKVYGRTGTQLLIATISAPTATYVDTGAVTPAGASLSATGAVRFRDRGAKVTRTQIAKATTTRPTTEAYFNR